jgi:Zn-dependent peptidase ImmA (M78 family)
LPLKSDIYYRALVERTLRETGIVEPPVDLGPVAARLCLPIITARLPAWFKGALVYEDGMPVVLLNAGGSEESRRDALAHMLAHLLVRMEDPDVPYPRALPDHRLADAMAVEFRAPKYLVTDQASRWFNDYRYLARLFAVSEGEMLSRMRELGLVKRTGVVWDY